MQNVFGTRPIENGPHPIAVAGAVTAEVEYNREAQSKKSGHVCRKSAANSGCSADVFGEIRDGFRDSRHPFVFADQSRRHLTGKLPGQRRLPGTSLRRKKWSVDMRNR